MSKLNKILLRLGFITTFVFAFFFGSTVEYVSSLEKESVYLSKKDSLNNIIHKYENTADYSANYNLEAKQATQVCITCSKKLTNIQFRLDSIKANKGGLVVSGVFPNIIDR
jgi:hypothetical protein